MRIEYVFVAVQPFQAEHPIGSGQVVQYIPGERFPGEDWGNAAHNLVEMGKAVRLAYNVPEPGGTIVSSPVSPTAEEEAAEEQGAQDEDEDGVQNVLGQYQGDWPAKLGGAWWMLSDGQKVAGAEKARLMQQALDAASSEG